MKKPTNTEQSAPGVHPEGVRSEFSYFPDRGGCTDWASRRHFLQIPAHRESLIGAILADITVQRLFLSELFVLRPMQGVTVIIKLLRANELGVVRVRSVD